MLRYLEGEKLLRPEKPGEGVGASDRDASWGLVLEVFQEHPTARRPSDKPPNTLKGFGPHLARESLKILQEELGKFPGRGASGSLFLSFLSLQQTRPRRERVLPVVTWS